MDWLEELRQGTDPESIWVRPIRQTEELPYQGLPEMSVRYEEKQETGTWRR